MYWLCLFVNLCRASNFHLEGGGGSGTSGFRWSCDVAVEKDRFLYVTSVHTLAAVLEFVYRKTSTASQARTSKKGCP